MSPELLTSPVGQKHESHLHRLASASLAICLGLFSLTSCSNENQQTTKSEPPSLPQAIPLKYLDQVCQNGLAVVWVEGTVLSGAVSKLQGELTNGQNESAKDLISVHANNGFRIFFQESSMLLANIGDESNVTYGGVALAFAKPTEKMLAQLQAHRAVTVIPPSQIMYDDRGNIILTPEVRLAGALAALGRSLDDFNKVDSLSTNNGLIVDLHRNLFVDKGSSRSLGFNPDDFFNRHLRLALQETTPLVTFSGKFAHGTHQDIAKRMLRGVTLEVQKKQILEGALADHLEDHAPKIIKGQKFTVPVPVFRLGSDLIQIKASSD